MGWHLEMNSQGVLRLEDFAALNKVYPEFFAEPFPARSGMEVSRLPLNAIFEIEVIAEK